MFNDSLVVCTTQLSFFLTLEDFIKLLPLPALPSQTLRRALVPAGATPSAAHVTARQAGRGGPSSPWCTLYPLHVPSRLCSTSPPPLHLPPAALTLADFLGTRDVLTCLLFQS